MEKLTDNIKYGCINYVNSSIVDDTSGGAGGGGGGCECDNFIGHTVPVAHPYQYCDIHKLIIRLKEYEELEMTPEEIRELKESKYFSGIVGMEMTRLQNKVSDLESELAEFKKIGETPTVIKSKLESYENSLTEYQKWLSRYHELLLTPDEIRQILKDGEDVADACIKYKNRCFELAEIIDEKNDIIEHGNTVISIMEKENNRLSDEVETLQHKAEAHTRIGDVGIFSFDDVKAWKEKADKYDELKRDYDILRSVLIKGRLQVSEISSDIYNALRNTNCYLE